MSGAQRHWLGGDTAKRYGCTVTFENDRGETLSGSRVGKPTEALHELIDAAQALDPSYRVVSYSTPNSILSDLQGRRARMTDAKGRPQESAFPEANIAARIKRLDAVHPRLIGGWRSHDSTQRARTRRAMGETW